jgi:diguanylate cyclase (GGDEF)-like protein
MRAEHKHTLLYTANPVCSPGIEIEKIGLFRGVTPDALSPFLRDCAIEYLNEGDVLIDVNKANSELYIVLHGEFGVYLGSPDNEPLVVVHPGEALGELALIDGKGGSVTVIAHSKCRVLVLDEELVWLLANSFHAVSTNFLFLLARRVRHSNTLMLDDREQIREYRFKATVDGLTELFNRYWLDKMLPRKIERATAGEHDLSFMMIDIDHFKRVNDTHGHAAGDEVLRQVAASIRRNIREHDLPVRYGGEEFAVICPDTPLKAAPTVAERIRANVASDVNQSGAARGLPVTISVGVTQFTPGLSLEAFVHEADEAMYRAKNGGRDQVSE